MSVSTPLQPADAITASLASQDVQEIRHYVPIGGDLMVMTNAAEWRVNSGPDSDFSQDTIKQLPETNWGSSHDVPIVIGKTILFVEDGGARVRSLGFSLEIDGFDTNDLTVLANHLLAEKSADEFIISDWAYGQFPESRIYMVRSDGKMLTMTFDTEQQVIAWTTWDTRGQFKTTTTLRRSVEGVEDGVYFGVRRKTSLGGDANFLERLHTRKFADIRNGFFVDLGFKLDNKFKITNITDADPAVITTEDDHGFVDGDEVEIVEVEWFKDIADECSDDTPNQFNDLRFTIANKTDNTFELLSHTTVGSGEGWDITERGCPADAFVSVTSASPGRDPRGLTFNGDGTKFYLGDRGDGVVYQYSMTSAYDVATGTYDGVSLDVSVKFTKGITDIHFGGAVAGERLYIMGDLDLTFSQVRQYDLSVAYDLSTAVLNPTGSWAERFIQAGFTLSNDGTKLFWINSLSGENIRTFTLTTPWELDLSAGPVATFNLTETQIPAGVVFRPDGTVFYILDAFSDIMYQYDMTIADDITTATYSGLSINLGECKIGVESIFWKSDGSILFGVSSHAVGDTVFQLGFTAAATSTDIGLPSTETYLRGGEVRKTVKVIRGIHCLEGLESVLFFDGSQEPNQTVVNGEITVDDGRSITRAAIGLPYTCDIELLDIEVGSGTASTPSTLQSKLKKISKVMVRFYKSRMPQIGPRSNYLTQMRPREFEKFQQASQLISGDVTVNIPPSWNSNGRIFFRQCDPVPLTILGVFPDMTVEDELE